MKDLSNVRYFMWNRLFEANGIADYRDRHGAKQAILKKFGYSDSSRFEPQEEDYIAQKEAQEKQMSISPAPVMTKPFATMLNYSFADYETRMFGTQADMIVCDCAYNEPKQEKKEHKMGYEYEAHERLETRLSSIRQAKKNDAAKKYHTGNYEGPRTKDEVLANLKAGNIEFYPGFYDEKGDLGQFYTANGTFKFVDPAKDQDGYDKAVKAIDAAYVAALDTATILTPAEGLAALREFEKTEF